MIVTLQTERVPTLDQVRAFVEGSEAEHAFDCGGRGFLLAVQSCKQALSRQSWN